MIITILNMRKIMIKYVLFLPHVNNLNSYLVKTQVIDHLCCSSWKETSSNKQSSSPIIAYSDLSFKDMDNRLLPYYKGTCVTTSSPTFGSWASCPHTIGSWVVVCQTTKAPPQMWHEVLVPQEVSYMTLASSHNFI